MVGTLKYHQALKLNRTSFRRRTGVYPETFLEMETVLQERHANKVKSGRPPALSLGAQLLMTLEFWREYRTLFHIGQDWGVHEATVQRTVVRVEDALIQSGKFSLPGKKALIDHGTVFTAVLVDVSEVPCERPKKSEKVVQRQEKTPYPEVSVAGASSHP